ATGGKTKDSASDADEEVRGGVFPRHRVREHANEEDSKADEPRDRHGRLEDSHVTPPLFERCGEVDRGLCKEGWRSRKNQEGGPGQRQRLLRGDQIRFTSVV